VSKVAILTNSDSSHLLCVWKPFSAKVIFVFHICIPNDTVLNQFFTHKFLRKQERLASTGYIFINRLKSNKKKTTIPKKNKKAQRKKLQEAIKSIANSCLNLAQASTEGGTCLDIQSFLTNQML